jgi:hypothetical protein
MCLRLLSFFFIWRETNLLLALKSNPTLYLPFIFLLICLEPLEIHAAENDWEFWNVYSVRWNVTEKWRATLGTEFKFDDDMSNHYYSHADAGVDGRLVKWFSLGINYRYIDENSSSGWRTEHRPYVTGTFLWNWGNVLWANRNMLEYRDREGRSNTWRYRNRTQAILPQQWTNFKIQPFLSAEILYQFVNSSWNQYRLRAGLDSRLAEKLQMNLYYMLRGSESDDDWDYVNILGLNFRLAF